jgi:hypothetical protein
MKKLIKSAKIISFLLCIVLFISMTSFTTPDLNFISYEQAYSTAGQMFSSLTGLTDWDEQVLTPLYDKDQNMTYYCFDFIKSGNGIGYILISSNLNNILIPEYGNTGFSNYYLDAQKDIETIYYNPLETYAVEKNKITDMNGSVISKNEIKSETVKVNNTENKILIENIQEVEPTETQDSSITPLSHPGHYENLDDPWGFIRGKGGTNLLAVDFSSLEDKIKHNTVYNYIDDFTPQYLNGELITNRGHCAVTAIANCMTYWRTICCGKLPANTTTNDNGYLELMIDLFDVGNRVGYIDPFSVNDGVSTAQIPNYVKDCFRFYGYNNAKSQSILNADWVTMADRIEEWGQPFILCANFAYYGPHAITVYAWNKIAFNLNGKSMQYKFLKVANGWDTEGRYINFDSFDKNNNEYYMIIVEPY